MATNGTFTYLVSDGLGSTSLALAANGSAGPGQLYSPYGSIRYQTASLPTDFGFNGQRQDQSGLDYYGARYYDPAAGQFASADTVVPGGGFNLWGLSRYAYTRGNPSSRVDPTGHDDFGGGDFGGGDFGGGGFDFSGGGFDFSGGGFDTGGGGFDTGGGGFDTGGGTIDTGGGGFDTGGGTIDTGTVDTGTVDTGTVDTGTVDTGSVDTGSVDTGSVDTGTTDTGTTDTGTTDTGTADTGTTDTGTTDTGTRGLAADSNAVAQGDSQATDGQNTSGTGTDAANASDTQNATQLPEITVTPADTGMQLAQAGPSTGQGQGQGQAPNLDFLGAPYEIAFGLVGVQAGLNIVETGGLIIAGAIAAGAVLPFIGGVAVVIGGAAIAFGGGALIAKGINDFLSVF
jgi:RHS repeat-associated protein